MRLGRLLLLVGTAACTSAAEPSDPWSDGKADGFGEQRTIEVVLTEPFCDICTADDKTVLQARSPVTQRLVAMIDGAQSSVDVANYITEPSPDRMAWSAPIWIERL